MRVGEQVPICVTLCEFGLQFLCLLSIQLPHFREQFHLFKNVQVGLSCQGLNSAVPAFEVVICAWAKSDPLNILYNTRISWKTQLRMVDKTGVDEKGVDEPGINLVVALQFSLFFYSLTTRNYDKHTQIAGDMHACFQPARACGHLNNLGKSQKLVQPWPEQPDWLRRPCTV